MSNWTRFKALFKREPKIPRADGERYSQIVRDYFNGGNHNVVELCDALGMTPKQLYYSCHDDNVKANILPRLPEKLRHELTEDICRRLFSEQAVELVVNYSQVVPFENLNALLVHIHSQQAQAMVLEELDKLPPIKAYIHSLVPNAVRLVLVVRGKELPLGTVHQINRTQLNLLMVNYGKLNPRGNRQSF